MVLRLTLKNYRSQVPFWNRPLESIFENLEKIVTTTLLRQTSPTDNKYGIKNIPIIRRACLSNKSRYQTPLRATYDITPILTPTTRLLKASTLPPHNPLKGAVSTRRKLEAEKVDSPGEGW